MLSSLLAAIAVASPVQAPNSSESAAQAAYSEYQERLAKASAAKATLEVRVFGRVDTYEYRFLRPNYAKAVSKESLLIQDGTTLFDFNPLDNEYFTKTAPPAGWPGGTAFTLGGVVGLESLGFANEPTWKVLSVIPKNYMGIPARAFRLQNPTDAQMKATLWVADSTGLPLGWDYALRDFKASGRIRNLELNVPLKPSDFAWRPPKGAKRVG